jgi:hypothetical protein
VFLGHYGVAFAAKRLAPRTSLGTTVFAAQFLDELWPILLLLGVERVRIAPEVAGSLQFVYYPWSHSLAMAIAWSLLIGAAYYALRRYGRAAWIVGGAVLSHWLLDVPVHLADLPLWPGSYVFVGFGLWKSVPATIVIELVFYLGGLAIYLRSTRARDRAGSWGLWAMVIVLAAFYAMSLVSPPPPNEHVLAVMTLGLWLFIPWGWWVDRHRENVVRVS